MNKETLEEKIAMQLTKVKTSIYIADPLMVDTDIRILKELCRDYKVVTGEYFQVKDNRQAYTRKE